MVSLTIPIVPDGFLSLNVERHYDEELCPSYTLWEEKVPPILVLEVVSTKPGGEYTTKLREYAHLGALYYVIYSLEKVLRLVKRTLREPQRDFIRHLRRFYSEVPSE